MISHEHNCQAIITETLEGGEGQALEGVRQKSPETAKRALEKSLTNELPAAGADYSWYLRLPSKHPPPCGVCVCMYVCICVRMCVNMLLCLYAHV